MKHRLIPLKSSGPRPWERFVTSYNTDYRPFSERHLQVSRTGAKPAPAFITPRQSSKQESWERYVTSYNNDYTPLSERHLQFDQLNPRADAEPAPALITPRQESSERYVTSYNSDYKPFSERHLQFHQLNPRTDAEAAPVFIAPLPTKREIWPVFNYYFYKTTNSAYGPPAQPPSCCLFPSSRSPFGILAESVSGATGVAGGRRMQDVEAGRLLGVENNGQLHSKVLAQYEAKDEPRRKINVLYERGTFVVSSDTACCAEFLGSVCREAGLQHLLNLPVASSPIIANKDAENWECGAYLGSVGPGNSIVLQPTSCWCNFCGRRTECPRSLNVEVQTVPPHMAQGSSPPPQDHDQPTLCSMEPLLTEYQTSYSAMQSEPEIQLRDYHRYPRSCHWNRHSSL